jgi:hypothetical protein
VDILEGFLIIAVLKKSDAARTQRAIGASNERAISHCVSASCIRPAYRRTYDMV